MELLLPGRGVHGHAALLLPQVGGVDALDHLTAAVATRRAPETDAGPCCW